jgi:serine protease AprX
MQPERRVPRFVSRVAMNRSISTINADVAQTEFGARGQGIVWAVVSSGVEASHPHFKAYRNLSLPDGLSHWDFTGTRKRAQRMGAKTKGHTGIEFGRRLRVAVDASGHGTGVAGVIAGESQTPSGELLRGMAPECKLLSINILDEADTEFAIIAALQALHAMSAKSPSEMRIHGVILPLELSWDARNFACGYSPVCIEVDRLVNSGVVVVAAAGSRGFDEERHRAIGASIGDPGNAPNAITVGSTHRFLPQEYGPSFFSARGPTADGRLKPDLLAPGERITTCLAGKSAGGEFGAIGSLDGTSFAAAHVSGAIAALLSVQRELIGRPLEVKELLLRTAVDLGREKTFQGAGLVDVVAALRSAREAGGQTGAAKKRGPVKVFCSYSHQDVSLWLEFKSHLSPMERIRLIEVWSDQAIPAGTEWEPQIYEKLESADLVLLFVSSFFVASDYCYSKEMQRALERHCAGNARVIPILVRPVDVDGTPIAKLQMLPSGKQPVTGFTDPHQGWAVIAAKLREIVMELRGA